MPPNEISRLFGQAKTKNEFEFIGTLINYKGPGSPHFGSNVFEWFDSIKNYERWFRDKKYSIHEKARFGLMLYSTFFELPDLYVILGSLARITLGYKATPYVYWKHNKANRWVGTAEKVSLIEEVFTDAGFEELRKFFKENHFAQIRHAFFHSTYAFDDDEYVLNEVEMLYIEHLGHHTLSLTSFIFPKVESILNFFHSFEQEYRTNLKSYLEDKILITTTPGSASIQVLGSEAGLAGFIDDAGKGIMLMDDVWVDITGEFGQPINVDKHVIDEIDRLTRKAKIQSCDGALEHLYDVIVERNIASERTLLGGIYSKFGDELLHMSFAEQNHFKMFALRDTAEIYYERMTELSPAQKINPNKSLLKYAKANNSPEGVKLLKDALTELLAFSKTEIRSNVLSNISSILITLKRYGVDISNEKRAFEKILATRIPVEIAEHAAKIANDISKL